MMRLVALFVAAPLSALIAQASPYKVTITGDTEFRVVRPADSTSRPLFARGRMEVTEGVGRDSSAHLMEIAAVDTLRRVHVDVSQDGRVVASATGEYVRVWRENGHVVVEARAKAPAEMIPQLKRPSRAMKTLW